MSRRQSRGEAAIEALLHKLDPQSDRYQVLAAARDFKASWVELGERLTATRECGGFSEWGYTNFEAYCRAELHLKMDTVNKLTRSFSFLRDHTPKALADHGERELPALDVVDLLSRARDRANVSDDQFSRISEEVFASPGEANKAEVMKRFREVDPDAFKPASRASSSANGASGEGDVRKALLLAERLASLLETNDAVSVSARDGAKKIVGELRRVFETGRTPAVVSEMTA